MAAAEVKPLLVVGFHQVVISDGPCPRSPAITWEFDGKPYEERVVEVTKNKRGEWWTLQRLCTNKFNVLAASVNPSGKTPNSRDALLTRTYSHFI